MPTKRDVTRVTVNLPSPLVDQVDEYAQMMNVNRTAAVAVLLSTSLSEKKTMADLSELLKLYQSDINKRSKCK